MQLTLHIASPNQYWVLGCHTWNIRAKNCESNTCSLNESGFSLFTVKKSPAGKFWLPKNLAPVNYNVVIAAKQ